MEMEVSGLDQKQFDEMFGLYYKDLTCFVYSFVNDREVARDVVHDLFLNLWRNRTAIDPSRSVKSYLFSMAHNQALNYLKHQRVIALNERGVAEELKGYEGNTEELEQRLARVRQKVQELSEQQRAVVLKCCVEGKMYREVAAEMNISENTVKTHLTRAMKFLREELREDLILVFMLCKPDFQ